MYTEYLDKDNRHKGYSVVYGGGDFCEEAWMERKTRFEFHCDPNIDFEMRYIDTSKPCEYTFQINTKEACHLISPSGAIVSGDRSFFGSIMSFYYGIFMFIVSLLYYILVAFVLFLIYKAITISMEGSKGASITKSIPFKERAVYYYYRCKALIIG